MAKKTLEEKIKSVCWWALGLTILYFLIGAWLISDGSKFDQTKTYNLLKDTLTLTAAFLAPVAAFVLFSDWRKEHREKKEEELSESIIKNIKEACTTCYMIQMIIQNGDLYRGEQYKEIIPHEFNKIHQYLKDSRWNLDELKGRLPDQTKFIEIAQQLLSDQFPMWLGNLDKMCDLQDQYKGIIPDERKSEYDEFDQNCISLQSLTWKKFNELKTNSKDLLI